MKARLARLRAAITKHKWPLAALGAVAVAGLAWQARSSSGSGDGGQDGEGVAVAAWTAPRATSPAGGYTAGGAYDSTASDIYGALQPQLEAVQRLLEGGRDTASAVPAQVQGYVRKAGTNPVYEALSDGTLRWVDKVEFLALGQPRVTDIGATDPIWRTRTVTTAPPPA